MTVSQYHPTWLDEFFHSFPHIDLTFQYTNSTFEPKRPAYREALGFFAALPVLWCLISLLLFTFYYCVQCCRSKPKKRRKTGCLKIFIGLMILLGCVALAFGFYGNEEVNDGVEKFTSALHDTNETLRNAQRTLAIVDDLSNEISKRGVETLQKVTDKIGNLTVRGKIQGLIRSIQTESKAFRTDIQIMQNDTRAINLFDLKEDIIVIEFYRSLSTLVLFIVYVFLNLFFLIGIIKSSKGLLMGAAVSSLLCLILIWAASGFYIGLSIGVGDLCVDPDTFVTSLAGGVVKPRVLEAYLKCTDVNKPFSQSIMSAMQAVSDANRYINKTIVLAQPFNISSQIKEPVAFLRKDLKFVVSNLTALNDVSNCEHIHNNYVNGLKGICHKSVMGLAYIVLMSLIVGLTITFAIAFASRTWPHLGKRRGYYPVDDTDPFLPRPPPYEGYGTIRSIEVENRSNAPSRRSLASEPGTRAYWTEETGPKSVNEEMPPPAPLNLPVGESPPPAYHPGRFSSMQQYNNLAPRPASMQGASET